MGERDRRVRATAFVAVAIFGLLAGAGLMRALAASQASPNELARLDVEGIEALLAREEIARQIFNYSRGLDRMDRELALHIMHPDGRWSGGARETFITSAWDINGTFAAHAHHMTNSHIRVDGDTAVSETYGRVPLRRPIQDGDTTAITEFYSTRYLDRWSKRDGRWALDDRQLIVDMHLIVPEPLTDNAQRMMNGRRDRTDASYQLFP